MHSIHSDGEWEPSRLVRAARQAGLKAIALTDHDTLSGIGDAVAAGEEDGVEILPGVEISSWLDADLHLLGYGVDPENEGLSTALEECRNDRYDRAVRIVECLGELGMPIEMSDVLREAGEGAIGRPHVARALAAAGHVGSIREAFDRWLGDGKPACIRKRRIEPDEAVSLIQRAGGVAVVAHPGTYGGPEILDPLREAGIDGVEVRHTLHGKKSEAAFTEYAESHGLLRTGGSDFHGPRPNGPSVGSVSIPYEWVEEIRERIRQRRESAGV